MVCYAKKKCKLTIFADLSVHAALLGQFSYIGLDLFGNL